MMETFLYMDIYHHFTYLYVNNNVKLCQIKKCLNLQIQHTYMEEGNENFEANNQQLGQEESETLNFGLEGETLDVQNNEVLMRQFAAQQLLYREEQTFNQEKYQAQIAQPGLQIVNWDAALSLQEINHDADETSYGGQLLGSSDNLETFITIDKDQNQHQVNYNQNLQTQNLVQVKQKPKSSPEKQIKQHSSSSSQQQSIELTAQKLSFQNQILKQQKQINEQSFKEKRQIYLQLMQQDNLNCKSYQYGQKILQPFFKFFNNFSKNPYETKSFLCFFKQMPKRFKIQDWCLNCQQKHICYMKIFKSLKGYLKLIQLEKQKVKRLQTLLNLLNKLVADQLLKEMKESTCPRNNFKKFLPE